MSQSIHRARRPLSALSIAGVLAAIAAFGLLNLPTDQPADAAQQRDSNRDLSTVAVTSALDAITLNVSNADLDAGDFLFFDIPGYRALNTVQTIDDPDSSDPAARIPDPQRACADGYAGVGRLDGRSIAQNGGALPPVIGSCQFSISIV